MTGTHSFTATAKRLGTVSVDRQAVYLALLFCAVQAAALGLAWLMGGPSAPVEAPGGVGGSDTVGSAAAGAGWAVLEVLVASVFVAAIVAMRKLPDWLADPLKRAASLGIVFFAGAYAHAGGFWLVGLLLFVGVYLGVKLVDDLGIWWLANNVFGLAVAVGGAAVLGLALSEWALLAFLVGMTAYDHLFADRQGWMLTMAGTLVRYRLPVLFVKPDQYRFEWDGLLESDGADLETSDTAWGIGTADLMLPAAFTVAVVTGGGVLLPAVAAVALTVGIALAALRIRRKMLTSGSGAGLPPLLAGVGGAYAVVLVPTLAYGVVV